MIEYIMFVQICTLAHGCEWHSSGVSYREEGRCIIKGLSFDHDLIESFKCVRVEKPVPLPRPRPASASR